jgi:hypothetical protein
MDTATATSRDWCAGTVIRDGATLTFTPAEPPMKLEARL